MFDGISLNDRIVGSRFDQAVNSMVCAASGAGNSMQGMEVSAVSHAPKMLCCHKMSQKMEIMSNFQPKKIGLKVRRNGPQPSICVRSFSPITTPQAKQVVDRFHLQKNFAEALEKFFHHHKRVLKKAAQHLAGKTLPPPKTATSQHIDQERKRHYAERVRRHKQIWKLFRAGYRKEEIAQIVGVGSRSVYRALEHEQPPTRHKRHWTHHLVDPYVPYLTKRWNEGCHTARELYQEIVAQGYTGSLRTLEKIVVQLRPHRAKLITKQTITFQKAPSPRNAALMIVRPQKSRTADQTMFIDQLCKSDPTAATVYTLAQAFGSLLRNREGKRGLEQWKGAVRASGIPELIDFMEGLADDAEAVVNACSESWNNGMTEGFVNKVKWIKRSSYGQAGFPLLQRRVLLHPTTKETRRKTKMRST